MKKNMCIVLCFIIMLFSFGCNKNGQEVRNIKYSAYFPSDLEQDVEYDKRDLVEILTNEITKEQNVDFYVLAPQDYRIEKGVGNEISLRVNTVMDDNGYKSTSVITERFAVCNEQKYGVQITDWGQVGGIAVNFQIVITIDMSYAQSISDLKFDYVKVDSNVLNVGEKTFFSCGKRLEVDIYNGQTCFASASWVGFGYADEASAKVSFERYVTENLMLKSEFLLRSKKEEFSPSLYSLEEKRQIESGYYSFGGCLVKNAEEDENGDYIQYGEFREKMGAIVKEYVNVYLYPGKDQTSQGRDYYLICAKDIDKNGKYIEQHLVETIRIFDFDLGGYPVGEMSWNININAIITSIAPSSLSINKEKITYDWIYETAVNVYYDGYCFTTITYEYNDYWSDNPEVDNTFMKNYVEEYVKENLKLS